VALLFLEGKARVIGKKTEPGLHVTYRPGDKNSLLLVNVGKDGKKEIVAKRSGSSRCLLKETKGLTTYGREVDAFIQKVAKPLGQTITRISIDQV